MFRRSSHQASQSGGKKSTCHTTDSILDTKSTSPANTSGNAYMMKLEVTKLTSTVKPRIAKLLILFTPILDRLQRMEHLEKDKDSNASTEVGTPDENASSSSSSTRAVPTIRGTATDVPTYIVLPEGSQVSLKVWKEPYSSDHMTFESRVIPQPEDQKKEEKHKEVESGYFGRLFSPRLAPSQVQTPSISFEDPETEL
ncbi:hypothetical protein I204_06909 [Kwoniella mangroviensis CBS 8886]|uniref:uncharacterized protein n=1 Tax=Kwoniella mangroviensis CBS 8507 TaxID=1296122 RepID=UPI00080CD955|nr:uncharacterized protein I203_01119 [Kwoniella mangroviensis CBS 8507]OCF69265.1 hypothetical protein I203_01119 [Kwoniella mangroviensis CBS 8507]OCF72527.1 hypothetical protein I204_06909 [Kwoniella mangroviensis CBS 8886]